MSDVVNLEERFAKFTDLWSPKVIARLKPYIDRFGYRQAGDAALGDAPKPARKRKPQVREKEPS